MKDKTNIQYKESYYLKDPCPTCGGFAYHKVVHNKLDGDLSTGFMILEEYECMNPDCSDNNNRVQRRHELTGKEALSRFTNLPYGDRKTLYIKYFGEDVDVIHDLDIDNELLTIKYCSPGSYDSIKYHTFDFAALQYNVNNSDNVEKKVTEQINPEPKPDIPMSLVVHAELEKRIKPEEQPCGYCGSLMEYKDVKFGEDLNHIAVLYKCPVCGRHCEKYRELDNYGVEILKNGDIRPLEEEYKQAEESEAYKDLHQRFLMLSHEYDVLKRDFDECFTQEGRACAKIGELETENEKLVESNRKLCERISDLQDKLDNLQHSLQPSKEECKCSNDIDYKAEYHRLLGQSRGLIKEINHYRRIVCELVHLI